MQNKIFKNEKYWMSVKSYKEYQAAVQIECLKLLYHQQHPHMYVYLMSKGRKAPAWEGHK